VQQARTSNGKDRTNNAATVTRRYRPRMVAKMNKYPMPYKALALDFLAYALTLGLAAWFVFLILERI
jgi:hypothetical protein